MKGIQILRDNLISSEAMIQNYHLAREPVSSLVLNIYS
jgi:hypothetical protein